MSGSSRATQQTVEASASSVNASAERVDESSDESIMEPALAAAAPKSAPTVQRMSQRQLYKFTHGGQSKVQAAVLTTEETEEEVTMEDFGHIGHQSFELLDKASQAAKQRAGCRSVYR